MAIPKTKLDAEQVVKQAYDEANRRFRVDAAITVDDVTLDVRINQEDDSIKIGDGVNLITSTQESGKSALDVHITNPELETTTLNSLITFQFDSIFPTYPNATTEIYTYKNLGSTVGVITVIYVDSTKNEITSIVRS